MKKLVLTAALTLTAAPALAHTGHGAGGLAQGLAHPFLGADHLMAMLAVGLWSGLALPHRAVAGPAAFLAAMLAGAGLGFAGAPLPMVEGMITLSVVLFGLLVLTARPGQPARLTAATLAAVALFGTFHGYAHAAEATGNALAYVAGFLTASTALHLAGMALARAVASARLLRLAAGAGVLASGLALIAG
ncbi:MAG: HupE/UreJ family protein [Rhodobacteraceae bacterium]|nr:HupE/UreJ family protein [Paracoccaceae bacterium]